MRTPFHTFCLAFLFGLFFCFSPILHAVDFWNHESAQDQQDQAILRAGDRAFSAKDYPVAVSFYTQYLTQVRKKGDIEAERTAYERLLDALIMGRFIDQAEKYLDEYERKFPGHGISRIAGILWRGEILYQKGKYAEAEKLYVQILPSIPAQDPMRFRVMFSYGSVLEKQSFYEKAADIFHSLWIQAGNTQQGKSAFQHLILSHTAAGQYRKALELLQANPPSTRQDNETYALLSVYVLLKSEGIETASGVWKNLVRNFHKRVDPMQYLLASSFADAFAEKQDYANALTAYRAAFHSASDKQEIHTTLNRMITVITSAGDTLRAAKLAMDQLELLKHSALNSSLKLRTARLLRDSGNSKGALELYETIFANINSPESDQKQAIYEYALILGNLNRLQDAEKTIRAFFRNRNEVEGEFLLAEVLVGLKRKTMFPKVYDDIAKRWPDFGERAMLTGASACIENGLPAKALEMTAKFRQITKTQQLNRMILYIEAAAYSAKGEMNHALIRYAEFIAAAPENDPYRPKALFHSGLLSFTVGNYVQTIQYLSQLKKTYPSYSKIPEASAWLIQAYRNLNNEMMAEKETWLLVEHFPNSEYAADALFRLASRYAEEGAQEKASAALNKLASDTRFPGIQARAVYELARQAKKNNNQAETLRYLNQLYESFPNNPVIAEGCFLHGDLLREQSDFKSAVTYYRKASELSQDPVLIAAANGSIGDCFLAIASSDPANTVNELNAAMKAYYVMLSNPAAPSSFKAMGTYRIGRCFYISGNLKAAAEEYLKLLYQYPAAEIKLHPEETVWCVRAAEALVELAGKDLLRSSLRHARTALHWLTDAGLLSSKQAAERFEKIKEKKLNP